MTFEHTLTCRKCCGKEIYKRPGALLGGILRKERLRRQPGEPSLSKTFYATFALLHIPQTRKSRSSVCRWLTRVARVRYGKHVLGVLGPLRAVATPDGTQASNTSDMVRIVYFE